MTSSERITYAVKHREPDRVPMHLNASKWVVERLMAQTGQASPKELLFDLHIDVYDTRGIDLHSGIAPKYIGPEHRLLKPGNKWGGNIMALWNISEFEMDSPHGPVLETEPPPLQQLKYQDSWEDYTWPDPDWFDFSDIRPQLKRWQDFSVMATGGSVFQHASYLAGLELQLTDILANPERAIYLHDKFLDFYHEYYRRLFEEAADLIDVFAIADDFGTQNSLIISPETFDNFFAHRIKKLADLAHHFNCFFLLHTCGNVESLIPRFIESGVDILDPIQPECMDPLRIKRKYGREICLRGGISSQQVLAHGTRYEVEEEVKRKLEGLMHGGGYIFSPGHPVLQVDIPTGNIIAMYRTAYNYGKY